MTVRARFAVWGAAWAVAVAAGLALVVVAYARRLPQPIAGHWGLDGAPDDAAPLSWFFFVTLGLWAAIAVAGLVAGTLGPPGRRRRARGAAVLVGGAVFVGGILGSTVWANLDAEDWQQARSLGWEVFAVLALTGASAAIAHRAVAGGPARADAAGGPAERVVWTSAASNPAMLVAGLVSLPVGVGFAVLGAAASSWVAAVVLVLSGLALVTFSSVRVHVSDRGLAVLFGPLRWPVRRIGIGEIDGARVEHRRPAEVGGWGWRGFPGGNTTIMLRGGECLVVRRASGGELGISVDDAERGADTLNTLT